MFFHNFKYNFKALIRNRSLIFWSFAFPIILATLFNLAFFNIVNEEKLSISNIAIINNEEFNNNIIYQETFKNLSKNNKNQLFNIKYVDKDKASNLLENDKIDGYLLLENNIPHLYFKTNGINQTILEFVTNDINSHNIITNNIIEYYTINGNEIDYNKISNEIVNKLNSEFNINDKSSKKMNFMMIEFYTLIAFVCLSGGLISMLSINYGLANMGNIGKRVEISPVKKKIIIFSSLLSSYIIQLLCLLLLFIYTIFIIKVDYGSNLFYIILLSLVGSLTGLSLGLCIGVIIKKSEGKKIGILLAITMIGSFLSGMMGVTLKYIIDKNIPIINKINPVNMITDGFYSLYYYNTLNRYYFNLVSLLIFAIIFIIISIFNLRRKQYDSI